MTRIYIREQGAKLSHSGERLIVSKQRQRLDEIPITKVSQVVLVGNVQITTQTIKTLAQRRIDLVLMSTYGNVKSRLLLENKYADLQQAQLRHFDNQAACLQLAQAIISGKINNQRTLLQRQAQRAGLANARGAQQVFERGLQGMMQMLKAVDSAENLDSLRGYEGRAAAFYFEAMRGLIPPAWGFARREFYPAPDPFNALLSFGYALVQKDVQAAADLVGLNANLGFFHVIRPGRSGLVIDMMEEWRPVVADAMALELVNRGSLKLEMFQQTNNRRRPIELGSDGRDLVLRAYESRLATRHFHPHAGPGGQTTLRKAMRLQLQQLTQVIRGERQQFEPFKTR